jgi:PhnB protein
MTANDKADIHKALKDHADAIRAKDAEKTVSFSTDGYTAYTLAPPLVASGTMEDGIKGLKAWFSTWKGPVNSDIIDPTIEVGGDIAFAYGISHMTGTKTDGHENDLWFRSTVCLKRVNGAWKIVHEHDSVPFYMDGSFKAAVDLKP